MDKRFDLLNYLLTQKRTVPTRELQNTLNISRRTVINYVSEINSFEQNTIISTNQGYRCIDSAGTRKILQELQASRAFDSFEKRRSFLLQELLLKSAHPTLDELADKMFISPATLNNELSRLRASLKEQGLYLKTKNNRLYIIGSDRNVRKFIMSLLNQELKQSHFDLHTMQRFFAHAEITEIDRMVKNILQNHSFFLDDFSHLNYVLHLAICIETAFSDGDRAYQGNADTARDDTLLAPVKEIIEEIYLELKKTYCIDFPFEQMLDASILMATRVVSLDIDSLNFSQLEEHIPEPVRELLLEITLSVHDVYGIDLKRDSFMVRFAFHLKNLLDRIAHKIEIPENSFITIKNDYPFLYVIAEFIASIINRKYNTALPEIEVSYIALHLGILMEETHIVCQKINCVLVIYDYYKMGVSIVENIKKMTDILYFSDIVTSYEQIKNPETIDLILTTLPNGSDLGIPEIKIHTLLTRQDYDKILLTAGELLQKLSDKELLRKLHRLFKKELFFPAADFSSREECIDFLCDKMEAFGYVDSDFRDEIYYHEKVSSSAYSNIALPHSLAGDTNSVQTSVIATAICRHSIPWGENQVDFIFLLSLRGEDRPLFKDLFSTLSSFLASEENCVLLKQCTDFENFLNLLGKL